MAAPTSRRPPVGWREWVALPAWDVEHIKAKVDTGARTSSLHAFALRLDQSDGVTTARFVIHPWQRSERDEIEVAAAVVAMRPVRSSSGTVERRPVVRTEVSLAGLTFTAEITLTRRDEMGFRMLLGREALRRRFVVDPGSSYLGGRPSTEVRRRNRGRP